MSQDAEQKADAEQALDPARSRPRPVRSLLGLLLRMFAGFVLGWFLCVLLGPQGVAGIAIVCTFTVVGAVWSWLGDYSLKTRFWAAFCVVLFGYILLGCIRATTGL